MTPRQRRASLIRRSHRSLGAGAALFVIFMVVTGIIINHSHSLGLDRTYLSARYLLDWYGLEGPGPVTSYNLGDNWLSTAGSQVFLDEAPVAQVPSVVGAVHGPGYIVVAAEEEWILLDETGQLIERQAWFVAGDRRIDSIGQLPDGGVVAKSGNTLWQADSELVSWEPLEGQAPETRWSRAATAPERLSESIKTRYRGDGLSFERILLDLHSGRFFGPVGVLVYDVFAIFLGFLAISGLIMWSRAKRNGKR